MILPADYVNRASAASADRSRFLLLVLEGGHALLVRARAALACGDAHAFGADLRRAQEVMLEVAQALDPAQFAPIADALGRLAAFVVGQLALASAERSLGHIEEVLREYAPILDAYRARVEGDSARA
jgi:flagellin-specific chaperone FliS